MSFHPCLRRRSGEGGGRGGWRKEGVGGKRGRIRIGDEGEGEKEGEREEEGVEE